MEGIDLEGKTVKITKHAAHRASKRNITRADIIEALTDPKNIRKTTRDDPKATAYSYLGRNDVVLILNYNQTIIITLMRRNKEYAKSKARQNKNKRQFDKKRRYGSRYKDK